MNLSSNVRPLSCALLSLALGMMPGTVFADDEGDAWCAWQFDRPDLGKGFAVFFRRPQCPQSGMKAALMGLEPAAVYEVRNEDTGKTERLTGAALSNWQVSIENARGSLLVTYTKQ